jgi:hypothetical protein
MKEGASIHASPKAIGRSTARGVGEGSSLRDLALAAAALIALVACGGTGAGGAAGGTTGGTSDAGTVGGTIGGTPDAGTGTGTADGTKGTGSGGASVPQPSTDAAAWFITDGTTSAGQAIDLVSHGLDFDFIPGAAQGGIPVGSSRPDGVLLYNVSRKADLQITAASIAGANPSDFSLDPANVENALATTIPPNKSAFVRIGVTFTPQAAGLRTGSVELTSNAGTASVPLKGTGLPLQPVLQAPASLTFIPTSAPAPVHVTNAGSVTLTLSSFGITGADASAFQLVVTNQGLFRCFAGIQLGALGSCDLEVGPVPGQVAPKSAVLDLNSDDPVHPTVSVQLTLQ